MIQRVFKLLLFMLVIVIGNLSFISSTCFAAVLFSSGFEESQAQAVQNNIIEASINVTGYESGSNCQGTSKTGAQAHTGKGAFLISGSDNDVTRSYCYYKVFDVKIPVTATTKLSYWSLPLTELARHITVDFICTDGSTLRDSGAVDQHGNIMHPGNARGALNTWNKVITNVGQKLSGKTIEKILVGYDYGPARGKYKAYIDDIVIEDAVAENNTYGSLQDKNIKYFGRWDFSNPSQYASYWCGSYIKVNFTGTTVKVKLGNTNNYFAKIDNSDWVSYPNASGIINLTPMPLAPGTHTLTLSQGKDYGYEFKFQGLILDNGAKTSLPVVQTSTIEFIGDSITCGYTDAKENMTSYAWLAAENLHCEHTQISYPGIALLSGYGANNDKTGMDSEYFKLRPLGYSSNVNWDFTKYTPKIIVINLGTNDHNAGAPDNLFQNTYTNFLANIRMKYPNAEIFVLRCLGGQKSVPTQAAVSARRNAGDSKLHYIDTTGWLTNADLNDGLHPSETGQAKVAKLLVPILAPYVKSK